MSYPKQIPVQDAIDIVEAAAPATTLERVPLARGLGRILAGDLASRADHPSVDNSALDGYAVRHEDTVGASADSEVRLEVIGEVPAGRPFGGRVEAGQAVAIYTGGAMPSGSDAIVRVEATRLDGDTVWIGEPADRGAIRPQAQDLRRGQRYLERGTRMHAGALALCAAMGHDTLEVARRPRLALLVTGDEVVAPGGELEPGQVYDANGISVAALAEAAGAEMVVLPRVGDRIDDLAAALQSAGRVDLLLTSGGVSMGRYDIVRDLLFEQGEVLFWKVAMKPGGPVLFGRWRDLPVLGLPGNPVSSMVAFLLLGEPFVARALGRVGERPYRKRLTARSHDPLSASGFKETFQRVRCRVEAGELWVSSTGNQSSGVLRSMLEANALAVLPPHAQIEAGDRVEIIPLGRYYG